MARIATIGPYGLKEASLGGGEVAGADGGRAALGGTGVA
jgi:hypothetical protein